jgi:ectoine hydroxylase-related dioxygenase (phytanoyl-CoA dioxygenase family)
MSTEVKDVRGNSRARSLFRLSVRLLGNILPVKAEVPIDAPAGAPDRPYLHLDSLGKKRVEYGLTAIWGWAYSGDNRLPEGVVEVALDDEAEWTEVTERVPIGAESQASRWSRRAGYHGALNTHMLENGVHRLRLRAKTASGEIVATHEVTFRVDNVGTLAETTARLIRSYSKSKRIWPDLIDSEDFPYEQAREIAWFERSNAMELIPGILARHKMPREYEEHLRHFVREGYIVIDQMIARERCEQINQDLDAMIASGVFQYNFKGERVEKLFEHSKSTRDLWADPQILRILSAIFDDVALPCQTLNFIHGSQQDIHQDLIHLTPFPTGFMCGVWVALEDIHPDSGPLVVYPGSHRLRRLYTRDAGVDKVRGGNWGSFGQVYTPQLKKMIDNSGLKPHYYTPKAGSVLIWHENLAHGGSPRNKDGLTRKSIVSHYFARGGLAFYDSQGTPAWTTEPSPD